jgi:hypothetical protein
VVRCRRASNLHCSDATRGTRASAQARLNMKPAGVGIVFQREETLDHQGLVVRAAGTLLPPRIWERVQSLRDQVMRGSA